MAATSTIFLTLSRRTARIACEYPKNAALAKVLTNNFPLRRPLLIVPELQDVTPLTVRLSADGGVQSAQKGSESSRQGFVLETYDTTSIVGRIQSYAYVGSVAKALRKVKGILLPCTRRVFTSEMKEAVARPNQQLLMSVTI